MNEVRKLCDWEWEYVDGWDLPPDHARFACEELDGHKGPHSQTGVIDDMHYRVQWTTDEEQKTW